MKILDTDTCVAILRGDHAVMDRRASYPGEVATTWITAAELFYGAAKSKSPAGGAARVADFLSTLPVLHLSQISAQVFGEVKALLERTGERLADADLFIAAIAVAEGATVVTGNRRHYGRIPGVIMEDWMRG